MKRIQNIKHSIHQEVNLLLPWYVNGTLQPDERQLVESHLKGCLRCKAELVEQQELSHRVGNADPLTHRAEKAFAALNEKIRQTETLSLHDEPRPASPFKMISRRIKSLRTNRNMSKLSMLAQAAIVLLVFGFLYRADYFYVQNTKDPQFRTLSSSPITRLHTDEIQVVFDETIKLKQINQILREISGEIVSGPSAYGVFIVRIDGANKKIAESIAALRSNNHVIFAEPAVAALSPQDSG